MKVTSERLPESQVILHIEVEPERSAKSIERAYQRLVNKVNIPGFRKGKAPRHVVERIIGQDALVQEGIDLLLPELYREAVVETGIEPIAEPQIDIVQNQPLVVNVTVPIRPDVKLGDYGEIRAEREAVTVRDEEVEQVLEHLRQEHAEFVPVERPAAATDRVTMDVVGRIRGTPVLYDPEGKPIVESQGGKPVLDDKNAEYNVRPDRPWPVPGFADQIISLKAGEEKDFELTFPPDYPDREMANKTIVFHVRIHDVKEQRLPGLDDEFAKTVGDYETIEALLQNVRDTIRQRAERDAENRLADRVLGIVSDQAQIELPEALIDKEIERIAEREQRRLREMDLNLDQYLQATKKDKEQLRSEYRADAIASLRRYLVLEEIAKAENIQVTPEEVDREINQIAEMLGKAGEQAVTNLRKPERRDGIAEELQRRKALQRLVALATGEESSQTSSVATAPEQSEKSATDSEASEAE